MPDEKSSKYAWEPRNVDSGRHKLCRYVPPYRVGFLRRIGLKTGIHFAQFGLESGIVFEGTATECMKVFSVSETASDPQSRPQMIPKEK